MINASPRLGALLAGGAALVAFGVTGSAMAETANGQCDTPSKGVYCGPSTPPDRVGGTASMNGSGNGKAAGRPAAGSVGNADDKNPQGQMPDAKRDGNNGYECDGNNGIAKTNPAHTGCETGGGIPDTPYGAPTN
jgi:hypothetical protein